MGLPVQEDQISSAEAQLGVRLPEELRTRLSRNNGGEVGVHGEPWTLYPVWDPTNPKTASRSANHILKETAEAREWPGFPEDGVAIGEDGFGNRLVLIPAGSSVKIWNHETLELESVEVVWDG